MVGRGVRAFRSFDDMPDYGEFPQWRQHSPGFYEPSPRFDMREMMPNFELGEGGEYDVFQGWFDPAEQSQEVSMPQYTPYPGESEQEFMARMMGDLRTRSGVNFDNRYPSQEIAGMPPMAVDPRAAAMAQMMGNPAMNPANTFHMGRTTEDFYDEAPVAPTPNRRVQEGFESFPQQTAMTDVDEDGLDDAAEGDLPSAEDELEMVQKQITRQGPLGGGEFPPTVEEFIQKFGREPATDSEMEFYYGDEEDLERDNAD